jgi:hypothetical protein
MGTISSVDEYLAEPIPMPNPSSASPSSNPNALSPPKPLQTGTRSSANISAVNEKVQLLALPRPEFVYDGSTFGGWSVKTSFLGHELEEKGPYASKQEAKDVLSGRVLGVIGEMEGRGELKKPEKSRKKKKKGPGSSDDTTTPSTSAMKEKDPGPQENHIGSLLEFQNSVRCPAPEYQEFTLGQNYACILTLRAYNPDSTTGSKETGPLTFGSMNVQDMRSSKKAARQNAARLGVEYYKSRGLWPSLDGEGGKGGIRKKKVQATLSSVSAAPPSTTNSTTSTYASRVASLAVGLSFQPPEYRYTDEGVPNFHTVACYFRGVGGEHEGPIGEVRHVFGKKKAKEECAKLVLEYLLQVKEKRLREFGIVGGGDSGEGRGGQGEGDEGEDGDEFEDEETDDTDEAFEDAIEDFGKGDV